MLAKPSTFLYYLMGCTNKDQAVEMLKRRDAAIAHRVCKDVLVSCAVHDTIRSVEREIESFDAEIVGTPDFYTLEGLSEVH